METASLPLSSIPSHPTFLTSHLSPSDPPIQSPKLTTHSPSPPHRKNLGPHAFHKRQRRLVRLQARDPLPAQALQTARQHNQHRLRGRARGQRHAAASLHRQQRRRAGHDAGAGDRAREGGV